MSEAASLIVSGVLMALALLNRSARAFALVLLISWIGVALSEWAQAHLTAPAGDPLIFYKTPSYIDAFAFSTIAILAIVRRTSWWIIALCAIAFVTVVYDIWFWQAYYLGIEVSGLYVVILQSLFLISLAVLVIGGYDVFKRVGSFLASVRNVPVRPAWVGGARRMHRKAVLEKRA